MALAPMFAQPAVATSKPFPEGDPRTALYNETLAALEHSRNQAVSNLEEGVRGSRANARYSQLQLSKAEPGSYSTNSARANSEGLLESGVNAGRRAQIGSQYLAKRFGVTQSLGNAESKAAQSAESANARMQTDAAKATIEAQEKGRESAEKEPGTATEPTATTTSPTSVRASAAAKAGGLPHPWGSRPAPVRASAVPKVKGLPHPWGASPALAPAVRQVRQNAIAKARARGGRI